MWPFKKIQFNSGALEDPRSKEEKDFDYQAEELVTFRMPDWKAKPREEWRKFPMFDQLQSGSCVAQSVTKALGIDNFLEEGRFVHLSARDIYARRANKPAEGMWFKDAMELGYKHGATLNNFMNGQKLNEAEMNKDDDRKTSDKEIGLIFKGGNYLATPLNIDNIAYLYPKPVIIGLRFWMDEYNRPVPKILRAGNPPHHHAICVVDFTLWEGKKALIVDESWGNTGFDGQRVITEDWFKEGRISASWYFECLKNDWRGEKPTFKFEKDLQYGMRNNDVIKLQDCLKHDGTFPTNQTSTGYYGNVTAKAVYDFQVKHNVASMSEIDALKGRVVGPKTRIVLNR